MKKFLFLLLSSFPGFTYAEKTTPFAVEEKIVGDHIANLAAHPTVYLDELREFANLSIPVWIEHPKEDISPSIYSGVFWELEPTGEYLYFLAGDFKKNEKGLLRYRSAKTIARVEVVFETDVIGVHNVDDVSEQTSADSNQIELNEIAEETVGSLNKKYLPSNHEFDTRIVLASMEKLNGARLIFYKGRRFDKNLKIKLIKNVLRKAQNKDEYDRLKTISIETSDEGIKIKELVKAFSELILMYSEMPYLPVSGATRI